MKLLSFYLIAGLIFIDGVYGVQKTPVLLETMSPQSQKSLLNSPHQNLDQKLDDINKACQLMEIFINQIREIKKQEDSKFNIEFEIIE